MSFCLVLLESTVIKFLLSTRELTFLGLWVDKLKMFCKVLNGEKQLCRRGVFLLLQDEHIIVLCFYFSC